MAQKSGAATSPGPGDRDRKDCLDLRLYVTDETPRCLAAYENLLEICEQYAPDRYRITVLDISKNPELARQDGITAIPTLIRVPRIPGRRTIIGMLTDTKKVLEGLDLPRHEHPFRNAGRILRH